MAIVTVAAWSPSPMVMAAELPAHDPMRILVVSDEVNPHGLSDAELTQPGEIAAALDDPGSGLELEMPVVEVDSQCIDDALGLLGEPGEIDVIVYFAHLAASACDGGPQQEALTAAFESHLQAGGGIVVFHHGIYEAGGKEGVLQLLGGRASSIEWDAAAGQDVIAVGGEHFVASEGVEYSGMRSFEGAGVPGGEYPFFNNTPDERYDATELLTAAGESRTLLFASAGGGGESPRVIGYDLHRPDWSGHVVFYQPGEYQPAALDDLGGNNFQIFANAIYYVATTQEDGGTTTSGESSDTGMPGDSGMSDASGGMMDGTSSTGSTGGGTSMGDTESLPEQDGGGGGGEDGCGCQSSGPPGGSLWLMALAGLGFSRRRRTAASVRAR